MNILRRFFKSIRRDAVARAVLLTILRYELKQPFTADDFRKFPRAIAYTSYQIADAMEEARNRKL